MINSDGLSLVTRFLGENKDVLTKSAETREKVTKDAKEIADESGSAFEKLAGKIGISQDALSGIVGAVGGAAAGITAIVGAAVAGGTALFKLAESASDFGSEIYDASQKTGLSAVSLSSLKLAADEAGSSLEAVSGGVTKFSKLIAEAAAGSEEAKKKLKLLGLEPKEAIKDLDGSLAKVFERIAAAQNPIIATKLATDAFGKSGSDLIPVIKSFDGDMAGLITRAKELGVALTDEDAAAADEFGDSLDDLKKVSQGVATQFALGFMPTITTAMKEISGAAANNKNVWREWGESVGDVILRMTRGARVAFAVLKDLFSGNYSATETLLALQKNAEGYKNDELEKQRRDSDFVKDQNKSIEDFNRRNEEKEIDKYLSGASNKKKEDPTKNWSLTKVLEAMRKGTMSQESGGSQTVQNKRTKATGLFQVTPENIKNWTKETFGREMSVEEFKKDAQAQIEIFNKYMGAYLKRGLEMSKGDWEKAIRIAAVQWYGQGKGEGLGYDDPTVFKKGEPTRQQYTKSVLGKTKKFLTGKDSDFDFDSEEKQAAIAEKLRLKAIKDREDQDRQILEINKRTAAEDKAILEKNLAEKLIREKEYAEKVAAIDVVNLQTEKTLLEQRLKLTELNADERAKIEEEISRIISDIKVKNTETETEVIKKQNEELEKQKEIDQKIAELRAQTAQTERERLEYLAAQERKVLANNVEFAKTNKERQTARIVLYEFDKEQAKLQKQRLLDQLQDEEDAEKRSLNFKEKSEEAKLEIENRYKNLRLTAEDEFQKKLAEIENQNALQKQRDKVGDGFFAGLAGGLGQSVLFEKLDEAGKVVNDFGNAWKTLGDVAGQALSSMAQGIGNMVNSLVLAGNLGGQSFRKLVAGILAGVASQAAVLAVMETAYGIAALTPWGAAVYGNPILHFKAAALFAGIALTTGLLGRAIAGDSFKKETSGAFGSSGSSASGSSSQSRDAQILELGRNSPAEFNFRFGMKEKPDWIEETWLEIYDKNGNLRGRLQNDFGG